MHRKLALAVSALLFCAAPGWASTFKFFESSGSPPGGPYVTAQFPTGGGLVADIDYDASTAEGGSLLLGPSEIEIRPFGTASLVAFDCQLMGGCGTENIDYTFVPGDASEGGRIFVSSSNSDPEFGVLELGDIHFDSLGPGGLQLTGCNYTDANSVERTCDPFTLVNVPEPGTGALLGLALGALAFARRRD